MALREKGDGIVSTTLSFLVRPVVSVGCATWNDNRDRTSCRSFDLCLAAFTVGAWKPPGS